MGKRIGFVSFRLSGTDGVSLETMKWAEVLERMGHTCYFMAGEVDHRPDRSFVVPEAHFTHPEVRRSYEMAFNNPLRPRELTTSLHDLRETLKDSVYEFVEGVLITHIIRTQQFGIRYAFQSRFHNVSRFIPDYESPTKWISIRILLCLCTAPGSIGHPERSASPCLAKGKKRLFQVQRSFCQCL